MALVPALQPYTAGQVLPAAYLTTDLGNIRSVINSDVVHKDIAGTITAANTFSGVQTFSAIPVMSAGLSVTGGTLAAQALTCTTLGASGAITLSGALGMSGASAAMARVNDGDSGASISLDLRQGNIRRVKLTAATPTITLTNPVTGASYLLELLQDNTGSRVPTISPTPVYEGGVTPTFTTTANRKDALILIWNGTHYLAVVFGQNFNSTV